MDKKEFKKQVDVSLGIAVNKANSFLKRLGLTLSVNFDYDFNAYDKEIIGVYENGSVFEGNISIGCNLKNLYQICTEEVEKYPYSDPYTIINETIQTNVYHEMGHGVVDLINDYLQYSDELDELYDRNQQLFDWVLDNEEDAVEQFSWEFYDNQPEDSQLGRLIELYINLF